MQSGTGLCTWGLSKNVKLVTQTTALVQLIDTSSSESIVESLRQIDYQLLLTISTVTGILVRLTIYYLNFVQQ